MVGAVNRGGSTTVPGAPGVTAPGPTAMRAGSAGRVADDPARSSTWPNASTRRSRDSRANPARTATKPSGAGPGGASIATSRRSRRWKPSSGPCSVSSARSRVTMSVASAEWSPPETALPPAAASSSRYFCTDSASAVAMPGLSRQRPRSRWPGASGTAGGAKSTSPSVQSRAGVARYSISQSRCSGTHGCAAGRTAIGEGRVPV